MKSNEEFRANVYARAEREKRRLAVRQKRRSASLSVALVLLVAAIAVPVVRGTRAGIDPLTAPETQQQVVRTASRAAPPSRMVLLMATGSGETKAVVLENKDQQKDFVNQYKAAMRLGDDDDLPMTPTDEDSVLTIRSLEELIEFLAGFPEAAGTVTLDYDEAFFLENNLCAMPMDLAAQPGAEEATTAREASLPEQMTTIPDGTAPDAETSEEGTEAETAPEETTAAVPQSLPEGTILRGSGVKVLLLVPVNKG